MKTLKLNSSIVEAVAVGILAFLGDGLVLLLLVLVASLFIGHAKAQTSPVLTAGFALNPNGVVVAPTNFWTANAVLNTTSNDGRYVNVSGDAMTGELASPGLVASFTNFVTIRPGLNLFPWWTETNSIIGLAVPTSGSASVDPSEADNLYIVSREGTYRGYFLAPGTQWLSVTTFQPATGATDTIAFDDFAYYISRASTNRAFATPDTLSTGYENVFLSQGAYGNYYAIDYPTAFRINWLWMQWARKLVVADIEGANGITATRSNRTVTISLGSATQALAGPLRVDATNLTIRVGSRRVLGTNVVEVGFAWNETNAGAVAWSTVTNNVTNTVTVYHSGNFSPGSYLSTLAWAGAQTGLLAYVTAPTSYNAAGSARQVSYGTMSGTNYFFWYSGTNWERIAAGARPW